MGRRTLMDIGTLIEKCVTGIDLDQTDEGTIVTSLMSPHRDEVSHGRQVYPLRFGQPFVDAIYDGYGEKPNQNKIQQQGNVYLEKQFPELSYIASGKRAASV